MISVPKNSFKIQLLIAVGLFSSFSQVTAGNDSNICLYEDFETCNQRWQSPVSSIIAVNDEEKGELNHVLCLRPNKSAECVLLEEIDSCEGAQIEGLFKFPEQGHAYLGFVYHYQHNEDRIDFDCVYIKGNGAYLQVNPHLDGNATRKAYPEWKIHLPKHPPFQASSWNRFRVEIIGNESHFYINDFSQPLMVFPYNVFSQGLIGFKPRFSGGPCWIDNLQIRIIETFSYAPEHSSHQTPKIQTKAGLEWQYSGPFVESRIDEKLNTLSNINPVANKPWQPFEADPRGWILAGKVLPYHQGARFVWFRSIVKTEQKGPVTLNITTLSTLKIWMNNKFVTTLSEPQPSIPNRMQTIDTTLDAGSNELLIYLEGGNYSGDGFLLDLVP